MGFELGARSTDGTARRQEPIADRGMRDEERIEERIERVDVPRER